MSPSTRLLQGHVLEVLRGLRAESVHCVVTSIPYWGLRSYKTEPQVWGGRIDCPHVWETVRTKRGNGSGGTGIASTIQKTIPGSFVTDTKERATFSDTCGHCGAWRGELGLEPTLEMFVEHVVEVFRELRRVLRRDGTLWLNIGDSYASTPNGRSSEECQAAGGDDRTHRDKPFSTIGGLVKEKDLCGQPWRVAFALQADGWYLRRDIIWHKPNAKPESIRDRPTTAHEYLFLLAKSERYFYDHEAVREPATGEARGSKRRVGSVNKSDAQGRNSTDSRHKPQSAEREGADNVRVRSLLRGRRSVWSINTQPYAGKHFAAYPERLVEPCILAGTSAHGCCGVCGAPWERVIEKGEPLTEWQQASGGDAQGHYAGASAKHRAQPVPSSWDTRSGTSHHDLEGRYPKPPQDSSALKARILEGMRERITTGWQPTCDCNPLMAGDPVPPVVLDPFSGTGTTLAVAHRLGRSSVGIDLQPDYIELARERLGLIGATL